MSDEQSDLLALGAILGSDAADRWGERLDELATLRDQLTANGMVGRNSDAT